MNHKFTLVVCAIFLSTIALAQSQNSSNLIQGSNDIDRSDIDGNESEIQYSMQVSETGCYLLSDGTNNLEHINADGTNHTTLGQTASYDKIEAIAIQPSTGEVFAADAGTVLKLDTLNGAPTEIGSAGTCIDQNGYTESINDIDGLGFGPDGTLWATERDRNGGGGNDLFFKIDPTTGAVVQDAFGAGHSCWRYTGGNNLGDLDDIAVDPNTNIMYAIENDGGKDDVLVTLDPTTGVANKIGDLSASDVEGLGISQDGTMYATTGWGNKKMYEVDKSDASLSLVALLFLGSDYEGIDCNYDGNFPITVNDSSLNNPPGGSVTQSLVLNDILGDLVNPLSIDLDPTSVGGNGSDTDGDGDIDEVVVPGEGVWTVDLLGNAVFTPESGFNENPTPIAYTAKDFQGNESNSSDVIVDYAPVAVDDVSLDQEPGSPVTFNITNNDIGGDDVVPSTVDLDPSVVGGTGTDTDGDGDIDEVAVPGEGTWSVDNDGNITFTPEPGFEEDPTVIDYTVEDAQGNESNVATVIVDYAILLPVEFLSFTVNSDNKNAILEWSTASELGNSHFEAQRSADGINFETVGRIEGAGDSKAIKEYRFVDENAAAVNDFLYYRIMQVDFDNSSDMTETRTAEFVNANLTELSIYPNPLHSDRRLVVNAKDEISQVEIFDATGRSVLVKKNLGKVNVLDLGQLSSGLYYMQVNGNQTKKILLRD